MSQVLVTGGSGFIGSHLCERLLADGHDVLAVDNFYSSTKSNVNHLLHHPRFELMRHDVTFPLYVQVDHIYHLACPASPKHYQRDPVQTLKTSVHGSINMLGLAKRVGAKILLASTSEIYGDPEVHPQVETYWGNVNPRGPRSCYDEGKRCAETLFHDYREQYGVDAKTARIFNTYGPRMHASDGRVVSSFISQMIAGAPVTVYGDGMQTRSFCYVDDLVDGLVSLMATPATEAGPINLGNPQEITIQMLASMIGEIVRERGVDVRPSNRTWLPSVQDEPVRRRPDITKAWDVLAWAPSTTLEQGLRRTVDWFMEAHHS